MLAVDVSSAEDLAEAMRGIRKKGRWRSEKRWMISPIKAALEDPGKSIPAKRNCRDFRRSGGKSDAIPLIPAA
jgi:hypothetical protein